MWGLWLLWGLHGVLWLQLLCACLLLQARMLLCASLLLLQLWRRGVWLLWLLPIQLLQTLLLPVRLLQTLLLPVQLLCPRLLPVQDLILQHTPQYVSDALDGDKCLTSKP